MIPLPRILLPTSALLLSSSVVLAQTSANCTNSLSVDYPEPVAADGWSYRLIAANLTRPRGIVFDTEGSLIVVDAGVGLVHISFDDDDGSCLHVRETKTLLENEDLNHGIAISQDGRIIYASTVSEVLSWPYDPSDGSLTSSSSRTLVRNMTNSGHTSRTLLLSRKYPDMLLVSRGSEGNDDEEALDRSSGHSQLRAFNISAYNTADDDNVRPLNFNDGDLLGWGLRNSVGVAEHPETGGIWSVENSVDNIRRRGQDIHTDNPGEELNFHGYLNGSNEDQGGNYGYPLCYALWSTENFPGLGDLDTGDQFPADRTNDDDDQVVILGDEACSTKYVPPVLAFQAHTAPLDIKFNDNGTRAFISFHGSWNRDDPVGYVVSSVTFDNGRPTSPQNSTNAATPILRNADLSNCPDECFRPVGLAWDSSDRLWFSSDSTGEIFVLVRTGEESTDDTSSGDGGGQDAESDGESGDDGDDSAASHFLPPKSAALAVTLAAVVVGLFLA